MPNVRLLQENWMPGFGSIWRSCVASVAIYNALRESWSW